MRLYARGDDRATDDPGSTENVALNLLERSRNALLGAECTELQQALAQSGGRTYRRHPVAGTDAARFTELVKRSANLTYCTTSAGALEALTGAQSFDWSIVEEAGKAHGFDLALPLRGPMASGDRSAIVPSRPVYGLRGKMRTAWDEEPTAF